MIMRHELRRAARLYRSGMSVREVAVAIRRDYESVRRALKACPTIEMRSRGRPLKNPEDEFCTESDIAVRLASLQQIAELDRLRAVRLHESIGR